MEGVAAFFEIFEDFEGVQEGAEGAVHFPDNEAVAGFEGVEGGGELGAVFGGGGEAFVFEDLGAACPCESVDLEVKILFVGGDAGVADIHGFAVAARGALVRVEMKLSAVLGAVCALSKGNPFDRTVDGCGVGVEIVNSPRSASLLILPK